MLLKLLNSATKEKESSGENQCLTPKSLDNVGRTKQFQQRGALATAPADDLARDGLWEYIIPNAMDSGKVLATKKQWMHTILRQPPTHSQQDCHSTPVRTTV